MDALLRVPLDRTKIISRQRGTAAWPLSILTVLAAGCYGVYSLAQFYTAQSGIYDLVIFDQAVRSWSRFQLPVSLAKGVHSGLGPHFVLLGDHFSPILALLAPLYWVYDGPQTLLVAQAVLLAAAIVPLWVFTRRMLGTRAAYCVALAYALSWPLAGALAFDFHEVAFVPLLFAVMAERVQAGRHGHAIAAAGLLLLVKEDMGILVAGYGAYLLTQHGLRRLGGMFVAVGLAWSLLAVGYLIPAFGGDPHYYWAYGSLGPDLPHAAWHAITHPGQVLKLLVTPAQKEQTMLWLAALPLFAALSSPMILSVLPLLAERMLADKHPLWWQTDYQYNAFLVMALFLAGVDGIRRLRDRLELREQVRHYGRLLVTVWAAGVPAAAVLLIPHFAPQVYDPATYRRTAWERSAAAAARQVPDGVLVEATSTVGPLLTARTNVVLWETRPRWAEWVVADVGRRVFPMNDIARQKADVAQLIAAGYQVVWQQRGFIVLHRAGSVPDLYGVKASLTP